jgi:hypothetical protein
MKPAKAFTIFQFFQQNSYIFSIDETFSEKSRFNVAITRMKALLVVVGNPFLLSMDVYWKELIQFAINNGILSFLFENVFVHEVILSKKD